MVKKTVKILKTITSIESSHPAFLPQLPFPVEVPSLLTDFRDVEEVPFVEEPDGTICIEESDKIEWHFSEGKLSLSAPLRNLISEASDKRYTLWGNQGFLYRYTLYLLEKHYGIFSFHACALLDETTDTLYVVIGGAGSGKTVYLLSGLNRKLQLFSTETVHFRIDDSGIIWYLGSLVDNIRLGTLVVDFPEFLPDMELPDSQNLWQEKIAIDLSGYRTGREEIHNPRSVTILFPRVEQGREGFQMFPLSDARKTAKLLFDNISQKISESIVLYDRITMTGLDTSDLASNRLKAAERLLEHRTITLTASVLTNPRDCWGDLLTQS